MSDQKGLFGELSLDPAEGNHTGTRKYTSRIPVIDGSIVGMGAIASVPTGTAACIPLMLIAHPFIEIPGVLPACAGIGVLFGLFTGFKASKSMRKEYVNQIVDDSFGKGTVPAFSSKKVKRTRQEKRLEVPFREGAWNDKGEIITGVAVITSRKGILLEVTVKQDHLKEWDRHIDTVKSIYGVKEPVRKSKITYKNKGAFQTLSTGIRTDIYANNS